MSVCELALKGVSVQVGCDLVLCVVVARIESHGYTQVLQLSTASDKRSQHRAASLRCLQQRDRGLLHWNWRIGGLPVLCGKPNTAVLSLVSRSGDRLMHSNFKLYSTAMVR